MDSVWFVFLFLPAVILLNYITPTKFRSIVIAVSSVLFLLFTDMHMLPLVLAFVLVDYFVAIFLDKVNHPFAKNALMTFSILFNIAVFALSQYITVFPVVFGGFGNISCQNFLCSRYKIREKQFRKEYFYISFLGFVFPLFTLWSNK